MIVTALRGISASILAYDLFFFRESNSRLRLQGWIEDQANAIAQAMGIEKSVKVFFESRPDPYPEAFFHTNGRRAFPILHTASSLIKRFNEESNKEVPDYTSFFKENLEQHVQNLKSLIRFSLSQQIALIKQNVFLKNVVLSTFTFVNMLLSEDTTTAISFFASIIAVKILFNRFAEIRADSEACDYTTFEEKWVFVEFYKRMINEVETMRGQGGLLEKILFTEIGESRFSLIFYPSIRSRLEKITARIEQEQE